METMNAIQQPIVQLDESLYTGMYDDVFPVVASIVSRQGGSQTEAEDIFQDALIAFIEMQAKCHIEDPARYIVGIAKHLWLRKARMNKIFLKLDDYEQSLTVPSEIASEVQQSFLLRFLQRAGSKCMDLLSDFYFMGLSIAELGRAHGLSGSHSASVQKNKCLEKVRSIVKEKQLRHEDFTE
ncbi:MAG: sigma-70 family RNA polymerase sigma factor [Chryseolinea sp.]